MGQRLFEWMLAALAGFALSKLYDWLFTPRTLKTVKKELRLEAKEMELEFKQQVLDLREQVSRKTGHNIVSLTQSEYDALPEKDEKTLYLIT